MGSIKTILRPKANKDGLFPIAIRITEKRNSSFIFTGKYIDQKDWDEKNRQVKKSHPNHKRLNNLILKKTAEANDKLLELETNDKRVSSSKVKSEIKKESAIRSFFNLADQYVENQRKSGKYTVYTSNKSRLKNYKSFLSGKDIDFRDITVLKLRNFQAWLTETKGASKRTIVNHLILIRAIYNLAINEKFADREHYPFGRGKIVIKIPESEKIGLEKNEVEKLESLKLENPAQRHALNMWLFSYYFAGMRVSDILRLLKTDFQNGRLFYAMGKNDKTGSLKVSEKAQCIIDQYRKNHNRNGTIFPELGDINMKDTVQMDKAISNADKKFNKHLRRVAAKAGITKPLTMHIARHTFGNLSGDKIPLAMLQKLYRHSSITTTVNYQKAFIFKDADDALESVIG